MIVQRKLADWIDRVWKIKKLSTIVVSLSRSYRHFRKLITGKQ